MNNGQHSIANCSIEKGLIPLFPEPRRWQSWSRHRGPVGTGRPLAPGPSSGNYGASEGPKRTSAEIVTTFCNSPSRANSLLMRKCFSEKVWIKFPCCSLRSHNWDHVNILDPWFIHKHCLFTSWINFEC